MEWRLWRKRYRREMERWLGHGEVSWETLCEGDYLRTMTAGLRAAGVLSCDVEREKRHLRLGRFYGVQAGEEAPGGGIVLVVTGTKLSSWWTVF